jgi:hypothetical protein
MSGRFFVSLLALSLLVFQQSTMDPNAVQVKERTERHAHYLSEPKLTETNLQLEITANDPRPLENVLDALAHQHGWHINYEDPQYGKLDILDDTPPSSLNEHPNGPRAYVVAGGAFYAKISVDGYFPDSPTQVLPALVEAYNRSDNPGRFELRQINHGVFDVVPTGTAEGPQKPILDTLMRFDTNDSDVTHSIEAFCEALSRATGHSVEFLDFSVERSPQEPIISLHVQNQPAREILRTMLGQVSSTRSWRLLYDPDLRKFVLTIRFP